MCTFSGDNREKELKNSHVVPASVFRALYRNNGARLRNRLIEMPQSEDARLDVTQAQGNEPMLCWDCEQRLSKEVERPALVWSRQQKYGTVTDADCILLARYITSVWWRAMRSKQPQYAHVLFDEIIYRAIIEATLEKKATLKNVSFRLRRFHDSSGGFKTSALQNYMATLVNHLPNEKLLRGHASFAMIAEGLVWEAFWPRLKQRTMDKLRCFRENRSRYTLETFDISREHLLQHHLALQYKKYAEKKITPAFKKALDHPS